MICRIYGSKRKMLICSTLGLLFLACLIGTVYLARNNDTKNLIILLFISSLIPIMCIDLYRNGFFSGKVCISSDGLVFTTPKKNIKINWNMIEYIVISSEFGAKSIGVFGKNFSENFNISQKYATNWNIPLKELGESFIFFEYKRDALNEIKIYWNKPIINEYKLYI